MCNVQVFTASATLSTALSSACAQRANIRNSPFQSTSENPTFSSANHYILTAYIGFCSLRILYTLWSKSAPHKNRAKIRLFFYLQIFFYFFRLHLRIKANWAEHSPVSFNRIFIVCASHTTKTLLLSVGILARVLSLSVNGHYIRYAPTIHSLYSVKGISS